MSLGLPQSSGASADRVPIVKYDARAGRIFRIDRFQDSGGSWSSDNVEITNGFSAVMDLENIEVGWLNFPAGGAPEMTLVKFGEPLPAKPGDRHKSGFRVLMKLGKASGADLREMASNAQVSIGGMDALHTTYEAQKGANSGKLPLVILEKTTGITTTGKDKDGRPQTSTNYAPVWAISKWVSRPVELGGEAKAGAVSPPPPPPPPPVDNSDEEEF